MDDYNVDAILQKLSYEEYQTLLKCSDKRYKGLHGSKGTLHMLRERGILEWAGFFRETNYINDLYTVTDFGNVVITAVREDFKSRSTCSKRGKKEVPPIEKVSIEWEYAGYYYSTGLIRDIAITLGINYDDAVKLQNAVSDRLDEAGCTDFITDTGRTFNAK